MAYMTAGTTGLSSAPSMVAMPGYQMAPQMTYMQGAGTAPAHHTSMMEKVETHATGLLAPLPGTPMTSTEVLPTTTTTSVMAPTTYTTVTTAKKSKKLKSKKKSKGGCC